MKMTEPTVDECNSTKPTTVITETNNNDCGTLTHNGKDNHCHSSPIIEGIRKGKCKWFNGSKGWGFVTLEDGGQDVFVHQSILKMSGFRQLNEQEEVEIECKTTDKGLEAIKVTGPNGQDCRGSEVRHQARRKYRKMRCYNCGEFQNHIASRCLQPPQPKRCHQCKSENHLVADCPERQSKTQSETDSSIQSEQPTTPTSFSTGPPPSTEDISTTVENLSIKE